MKISIIIPVYNVENYLRQCLDSVINQTLQEIEIICVNDGSTDKSLKILEEYANKDKRIKIINKENAGIGAARNEGIELAQGEYIGFVDSDDWIDKNMFKKLYENARLNDCDLVMCPIVMINEHNEKIKTNPPYNLDCFGEEFDNSVFNYKKTKDFIFQIAVNAFNKIYKTNFIKRIDAKFPEDLIFEDNTFFYQSFLNANKISLVRDFLYFHRVNRSDSTMNCADENFFDIIKIKNLNQEIFSSLPDYEEFKLDLLKNKVHGIFQRYFQVPDSYRQEFFELIKKDFKEMNLKEEDIKNLNLKTYYLNTMNSQTSIEFELHIENQKLSYEIKKLTEQNQKLSKESQNQLTRINKLTQQNQKLLKIINYKRESNFLKNMVVNLRHRSPYLFIISNWDQGIKKMLINLKGYRAIKKHNLVDIDYYLKNNCDVRLLGLNPIIHYMYHGYKEGRNPNPSFDGDYYLKKYGDAKKSRLNPLVHYSLYGIKEGREHQEE